MNPNLDTYSRLQTSRSPRPLPTPTPTQKAVEVALFAVFGLIIALAGVALYATNRPGHQRVPNYVASGLTADRVNVLLIGSSMRTRSGRSEIRIESLMLLSIQPSTGRAALMSIPVDLWVKVGRYGPRPLRAAHSVGDASGYPGAGAGLTVDTIATTIGQPIHAFVRFSIGDVQRVVDAVGGVEIEVQRGVYEYRDKLRFHRGVDRFDGLEAMRYAYSPHVAGPAAANRFARERRQQEVILAAMEKAIRRDGGFRWLEPVFGPMTATNLSREDATRLASALRRGGEPRPITFDPYLEAFDVTSVTYRGEAVRPRSGNFGSLHQVAAAAFDAGFARVH